MRPYYFHPKESALVARRFKAGFIYLQEVRRRFPAAVSTTLHHSKKYSSQSTATYLTKLNTADLHLLYPPLSHNTKEAKNCNSFELKGQLKQTGCQFFDIVSRISIGRPHIPESSDLFPVCKELLSLPSTFRLPGSAAQNIPATLVLLVDLPLALASIAGTK